MHIFISPLGKQRQVELCKFKVSLIYRAFPGWELHSVLLVTQKLCIKEAEEPTVDSQA